MSIEKDVEKLYMEDAEKKKKNKLKKKKKRITSLIIIILIIVALILLMNYLGLGFGGKKGEGSSESDVISDTETTVTSQTEIPKEYIEFKVSGSTYIYQGQEVSLDKFCETVKLMSDNVVVSIIDDNAVKNAMDDAKKAFDSVGREYVIAQNTVNSISESSENPEIDNESVTDSYMDTETEMVP